MSLVEDRGRGNEDFEGILIRAGISYKFLIWIK